MKNALISAFLTVLLCIFIFPCFVNAEESETVPPVTEPPIVTEPPTVIEPESEAPSVVPPTLEETETTAEGIVAWLSSNIEAILSGGSVLGTVLIAYAFRKWLLPLVGGFVDKTSKIVGDVKETTEQQLAEFKDLTEKKYKEFMDHAAPVIDSVKQYEEAYKSALELVEKSHKEREALMIAVREQTAITLSMIEGSRLPESVKEKARLSSVNTDKAIAELTSPATAQILAVGGANASEEG